MGQDLVGRIVEPGYKLNTLSSTCDCFTETMILKSPYNFARTLGTGYYPHLQKKKKINLSGVIRLLKKLTRNLQFCLIFQGSAFPGWEQKGARS